MVAEGLNPDQEMFWMCLILVECPPPPSAALEEMHWMEGTMPHWKGEGKPYLVPSTLPEVLALASRRIMGDWWTGPEGFQDCGGWGRAGAPGWLREGRESCIVRPGIGL